MAETKAVITAAVWWPVQVIEDGRVTDAEDGMISRDFDYDTGEGLDVARSWCQVEVRRQIELQRERYDPQWTIRDLRPHHVELIVTPCGDNSRNMPVLGQTGYVPPGHVGDLIVWAEPPDLKEIGL